MEAITFFRAGLEAADQVTDLRIQALEIFQGPRPPEFIQSIRQELHDSIREMLGNNTYICWLAELNGSIVGSGGMSIRLQPGNFGNPSGRTAYIMSMYTNPEYRGRGICSELVRRLIATGTEMGIRHFELHATAAGEPVYQKLGFLKHDEPTFRLQVS